MSNILEIDKKISEWCSSISIDEYTCLINIFSKLTDETFESLNVSTSKRACKFICLNS